MINKTFASVISTEPVVLSVTILCVCVCVCVRERGLVLLQTAEFVFVTLHVYTECVFVLF